MGMSNVRPSVRPLVRPSVLLSVRPSVCPSVTDSCLLSFLKESSWYLAWCFGYWDVQKVWVSHFSLRSRSHVMVQCLILHFVSNYLKNIHKSWLNGLAHWENVTKGQLVLLQVNVAPYLKHSLNDFWNLAEKLSSLRQ